MNERLVVHYFQVGLPMLRYDAIFVVVIVVVARHTDDWFFVFFYPPAGVLPI